MGKGKGHIPIRTCISCGVKKKNKLIRLSVNGEGRLLMDVSRKMHGRGAYICNLRPCIDKLFTNKRLKNIFRTTKNITISPDLRECLYRE